MKHIFADGGDDESVGCERVFLPKLKQSYFIVVTSTICLLDDALILIVVLTQNDNFTLN